MNVCRQLNISDVKLRLIETKWWFDIPIWGLADTQRGLAWYGLTQLGLLGILAKSAGDLRSGWGPRMVPQEIKLEALEAWLGPWQGHLEDWVLKDLAGVLEGLSGALRGLAEAQRCLAELRNNFFHINKQMFWLIRIVRFNILTKISDEKNTYRKRSFQWCNSYFSSSIGLETISFQRCIGQ